MYNLFRTCALCRSKHILCTASVVFCCCLHDCKMYEKLEMHFSDKNRRLTVHTVLMKSILFDAYAQCLLTNLSQVGSAQLNIHLVVQSHRNIIKLVFNIRKFASSSAH